MKRVGVVLVVLTAALVAIAPRPSMAEEPVWKEACPAPAPGHARCFAEIAAGQGVITKPFGVRPNQLKKAYRWPTANTAGAGQTVAVISAYFAPNIESDLAVFSNQYGLPACTTGNGCFTRLFGSGVQPSQQDAGWGLETTMDVEWVHAIAPGAKVLLVEAATSSFVDLFQAFNEAVNKGAKYITASWGATEFASETTFDPLLQIAGVSEFFGSGDTAAPGAYPAASPDVIAVGGTRLLFDSDGKITGEKAWTGSGGGCSQYYAASAIQTNFAEYPATTCAGQRAFPDVAALADPYTGASIYYSVELEGTSGWATIGGTSLSTPMIGARAAITGVVWDAAYVYNAARSFYDVKKGNNGYYAGKGFDLVTGRGRFLA